MARPAEKQPSSFEQGSAAALTGALWTAAQTLLTWSNTAWTQVRLPWRDGRGVGIEERIAVYAARCVLPAGPAREE